MLRTVDCISKRTCSLLITGVILFLSVPLLFFHSGPFQKVEGWVKDRVRPGLGLLEEAPELSRYYEWDTRSQFQPVDANSAKDASIGELCRSFPSHLLDHIQPVLKTGHATLHDRLVPHLQSVSACLDNLIVFSDLNEELDGHEIIDVIADIPEHLWRDERIKVPYEAYHALQSFAANGTLDQADLSEIKGWKTDKLKFLSGVSRAWKMSPEKQWYVFYEDDTYIVWDNVFRLLEQFNPDEPHYFGSPSPGCHPEPDITVWFANGGPGYILSREAMRRLIAKEWNQQTGEYLGSNLQERYWEGTLKNCCGDSILGCVLWMNGVKLSGLWPMFNVQRPHRLSFSKNTWCKPVLSMHKPLADDLRGIWRWEWERRQANRPLLFRDIATSYFNFTDLHTLDDWDNTGRGTYKAHLHSAYYTHDPHESPSACQKACEALPRCMQWAHHLRKCKIDEVLHFGQHRDPELGKIGEDLSEEESLLDWSSDQLRFRSGWAQERVKRWIEERSCEKVEWVRPSLKRIF